MIFEAGPLFQRFLAVRTPYEYGISIPHSGQLKRYPVSYGPIMISSVGSTPQTLQGFSGSDSSPIPRMIEDISVMFLSMDSIRYKGMDSVLFDTVIN